MELFKIPDLVRPILASKPETREDDYLLWLEVMKRVCEINRQEDFTERMTISDFLSVAKYSEYPSFMTVSRTRRKLQEQYPELRATIETRIARREYEKEYRRSFRRHE